MIGISICDFELWPSREAPYVPMLSRWRMQEQQSGVTGLPQLQLVFLELPKYEGGDDPQTFVDKWAYFFREAGNLLTIPEALRHPPLLDALEGARTSRFNREECPDPHRVMQGRCDARSLGCSRSHCGLHRGCHCNAYGVQVSSSDARRTKSAAE